MWAIYTEYRYAWNRRDVGLSLAAVGVCSALVSALLVGPAVKRFGERVCLVAGLVFGTLGFLGFAFAPRGAFAFAAIPLIALWGIAGPAIQSLMSQRVDPSSQGKLQGAINSLRSITGMAGPPLFTQVFTFAIAAKSGLHFPGAPYFLAALLLFSSLLIAIAVLRAHTPSASPAPSIPEPS
jgi:DHA1 family tetracycline resistance protein-like MFS transporter